MRINSKQWNDYVNKLANINATAAAKMESWIEQNGIDNIDDVITYALALSTKYGEAAASVACEMYDGIAIAQKASVPTSIPADTAKRWELFKNISGAKMQNRPGDIPEVVGRSVKQVGADTVLKNAKRDGAYFAWVNHGNSCAYCFMLAAGGWRRASARTIRGDHAEHIHNNCRCEFVIDFNGNLEVEGYNPDYLKKQWEEVPGRNEPEKRKNLQRILDTEMDALLKYKSSESYKINASLRELGYNNLSSEDKQFVDTLDSALTRYPQYQGNLFRDIDFSNYSDSKDRIEACINEFGIGKEITIPQYWSTAKAKGYIERPSIRIYIEDAKAGRDISDVGIDEMEVLYERSQTFKVMNKTYNNNVWHVLLKEI